MNEFQEIVYLSKAASTNRYILYGSRNGPSCHSLTQPKAFIHAGDSEDSDNDSEKKEDRVSRLPSKLQQLKCMRYIKTFILIV